MNFKPQTYLLVAIAIAICGLLIFPGHGRSSADDELGLQIARAYGVQHFYKVERLKYTFNVTIGAKQISRSWTWEPRADRVTLHAGAEGSESFTYERKTLSSQPSQQLKKVDAQFINDQYWLLFPLHLVWDPNIEIVDMGLSDLPIGEGQARRIVVTYPPTGGYTPGDVYELFVAENSQIQEWIYRRGGALQPTRMSTWEQHRRVGPLTISMDHHGPEAGFRVWFTDVAVQLSGQSDWLSAD
jgi:hypothetical protein